MNDLGHHDRFVAGASAWHRPAVPHAALGFSLVEAVFCTLLAAMTMVAGLSAVGYYGRGRTSAAEQVKSIALGRALLSEICQMRYADPLVPAPLFGPEAGETRATFNDVDDFDGWQDNAESADGVPIPGYAGWKRHVWVQWVSPNDPKVGVNTDQGLKRITVQVTSPTGGAMKLVALRSAYAAYEHQPNSQVTYTSWVGITLQVGSGTSDRCAQGVNPVGLVP